MKKLLMLICAVIMAVMLSVNALAVNIPSKGEVDPPKVVPFEYEGEWFGGEIINNNQIIVRIGDEFVIVTNIADMYKQNDNITPEKMQQIIRNLVDAYQDVKDAKTMGDLNVGLETLARTYRSNATSSIFKPTHLFDLSLSSMAIENYEEYLKDANNELLITLDYGGKSTDPKPVILFKNYDVDNWNIIDNNKTVINNDGTITTKFPSFGVVLILKPDLSEFPEEPGKPSDTGDTANVGLWIGICGVAVVAFAVIAIISRKRDD